MNREITARLKAFLNELALVLGGLVRSQAEVSTAQAPPADYWLATLKVEGTSELYTLAIDQKGATRVTGLVSGAPVKDGDATIPELLRRVLLEVTKACAARPEDERLDVTLNELTLTSGDAADDGEPAVVCAIGMAGLTEPLLVAARVVDGSALGAPDLSGGLDGSRVDVILDIDLPVVVRFGHTELSIRALSRLGPGSVIDLGRSPDDPVEVLVSNRVVAHGEVVIVGGNYGVRILDVASRSERVRSMEA